MYDEDIKNDINEIEPLVLNNQKKKKSKLGRRIGVMILCGAILGSTAAVSYKGVSAAFEATAGKEEDEAAKGLLQNVSYNEDTARLSQSLDVSQVAEGFMPAMVSVKNTQEISGYSFFGGSQTQQYKTAGSGIIIGNKDDELIIVSNNHVVEGATTLSVGFIDGTEAEATIKGTDVDNDIAVLAVKRQNISADTVSKIKVAELGESDSLKVGQQVVAVGNSLGYGQSVTTGIVSALNRQISTSDSVMIQTDAAINPGNSGGALINMQGQVVGINSAKFTSTDVEGMGYAISITAAKPIIEGLTERVTREKVDEGDAAYLGIYGEDVNKQTSQAYGIPEGIYINKLVEGGPAELAEVPEKSILTHFDGIKVSSMEDLKKTLQYYAAGETVEIKIQVLEGQEYIEKILSITLSHAPDANSR